MNLTQSLIETPLGQLRAVASERALVALELPPYPPSELPTGAHAIHQEVARQLTEYFAGRRARFELPLEPEGTPFQRQVWAALQEIPYGETRSYGEIAARLGSPGAVRAVGAANGRNPIAVVIPCHRVIGADGSLTGYAGGLALKQRLLEHEGVGVTPQLLLLGAEPRRTSEDAPGHGAREGSGG